MMLFILNKQERVVGILKNGGAGDNNYPFFDDVLTEDLATGSETYTFSTLLTPGISEHLTVGNYVAFKKKGKYKLFQIMQTEERHDEVLTIDIYCESAGLSLINHIFRGRKLNSVTLRGFLENVLEDTSWNVGNVDYGLNGAIDLEVETGAVYSILQNNVSSKFSGEIEFRVEINKGRISNKFVDVYAQRGRVTGKRFEFGKDIAGLTRNVDSSELYTALIGKGKDGLSFRDITVDGIDKPAGQDFVADQEAFETYNHNGYHLMGVYEYDTEDAKELLEKTYEKLQELKEPKVTYEVDVEMLGDDVNIGDTVGIIDSFFNPPILLMARVSKLETSFTDADSNKCTLSNFVEVTSNISKELLSQLEGFVSSTISDKFPIKEEDISDGAVTADKIFQHSITTDHLKADSITAELIKSNQIQARHIQAREITAEHIQAGSITSTEIATNTITADSAIISHGAITTANIQDGAITNAKIGTLAVGEANIRDASITNAKIKDLSADKITAGSIDAKRLTANIIEAINMSVSGKITADKIDANSLVVDNIDAGKITTGTLDANRIKASVISAINASIENATIDSAKIGDLSADKITSGEISTNILASNVIKAINASIGKISADRIDVDSIKVGNIDADQITSGNIDTDRLQANVIAAINSYAGTMKIQQGQIETLRVGNANITDLDVSKLKGNKIDANLIDVDKIVIKEANISGTLSASKISGGTLDASKMTVTNLKADSITAGAITVEGENLIHNTAWKNNTSNWSLTTGWSRDTSVKFEGENTLKCSLTDLTSNAWRAIYSEFIPCTEGEAYVTSIYIKSDNVDTIDANVGIEFEFYGTSNDRIGTSGYSISKSSMVNREWKRLIHTSKIPSGKNITRVRMRLHPIKNGVIWVAKPMLSRGTIASIWKPHTDELISSGAITNDKIANNAVNSDKLNIQELFVGNNAFINSLKAVEIDASNITTGKISNDRIDINGLVSFEALDNSLKQVFSTSGNKTYINGGMIATNTINADKLNVKGLTVTNNSNITSFAISKEGDVEVNGLLRSSNFDVNKNTGYQISTNGKAILNQAEIRGDIKLPNAGITNYGTTVGNENLIKNSDFRYGSNHWSFANCTSVDTNKLFEGSPTLKISKTGQTADNWNGANQDLVGIVGNNNIKGKVFTVSFWYYVEDKNSIDQRIAVELKGKDANGNHVSAGGYWSTTSSNVVEKKWTYVSFKLTPTADNLNKLFIYPWVQRNGTVWYAKIKVELSSEATPWCPHKDEQINYTRFWAGTSFENRDNAPFRVLQNGDLVANKGTFGGTVVSDEVNVGNIHLHENQIVLNSVTKMMNEDGEVCTLESRHANANPFVNINTGYSLFNNNMYLGSLDNKKVEFINGDNLFNMYKTKFKWTPNNDAQTSIAFNPNGGTHAGLNLIGISGGVHILRHSTASDRLGTMIFDSQGNQGQIGDFSFTRKNHSEDVKVEVDGELVVKTKITGKTNKMEMRATSTGFAFYAV